MLNVMDEIDNWPLKSESNFIIIYYFYYYYYYYY